jgi:hypothetical protein
MDYSAVKSSKWTFSSIYNLIDSLVDCSQKIVEITIDELSKQSSKDQFRCEFLITVLIFSIFLVIQRYMEITNQQNFCNVLRKFARFSINLFWRTLIMNLSDQRPVATILHYFLYCWHFSHYDQPYFYVGSSKRIIRFIIVEFSIVNSKTIVFT